METVAFVRALLWQAFQEAGLVEIPAVMGIQDQFDERCGSLVQVAIDFPCVESEDGMCPSS